MQTKKIKFALRCRALIGKASSWRMHSNLLAGKIIYATLALFNLLQNIKIPDLRQFTYELSMWSSFCRHDSQSVVYFVTRMNKSGSSSNLYWRLFNFFLELYLNISITKNLSKNKRGTINVALSYCINFSLIFLHRKLQQMSSRKVCSRRKPASYTTC